MIFPQQVRQVVGAAREAPHTLRGGGAQDLSGVPEVLGPLAPLVQVLVAGVLGRRPHAPPPSVVDAPQSRADRVEAVGIEGPSDGPLASRREVLRDGGSGALVGSQRLDGPVVIPYELGPKASDGLGRELIAVALGQAVESLDEDLGVAGSREAPAG